MNKASSHKRNLIVIGSSTGGPRVLNHLFSELPAIDASIIIVQHVPPVFDKAIANRLDSLSPMRVKLASDGDMLENSTVYFAQAQLHLKLLLNYKISLVQGATVNCCIPSINVTMKSLQRKKHGIIIGIVLTGMGSDGAEGITHIKQLGGITIAQDKESSTIYGMPKNAAKTGNVDYVLHENEISRKIVQLVGKLK